MDIVSRKSYGALPATVAALSIPVNYTCRNDSYGCCGMAGSFGYEKEHYELSMQIGEMVLFPAVRSAGWSTLIAAPSTSAVIKLRMV
jgi:Fe-S oxidoreductase